MAARPQMPAPSATELDIKSEVELMKESHRLHPDAIAIGTRASALALAQAYLTQAALASLPNNKLSFQVTPMSTSGDKNQSTAIYLLGGKSFWTKELEVALLQGAIDLIVHSLKDVPTTLPDGCTLGAILQREDPRDCLVVRKGLPYKSLRDLPDGSIVGTSSVRRVAQLRRAYPRLLFADARGNINTRLAKLDAPDSPFTALILAAAGLRRVNLTDRITCCLSAPELYWAVGQGALGIEIRAQDGRIQSLIAQIDHWQTNWTCSAEREMLRCLEGGCSVPVGVTSSLEDVQEDASTNIRSATLRLSAIIASLSGEKWIESDISRRISSVDEARAVGADIAEDLIQKGGKQILAELGRKVEDDDFRQRHEEAVKRAMERAKEGTLAVEDERCGQDLKKALLTSPRMKAMSLPGTAVNGAEHPNGLKH